MDKINIVRQARKMQSPNQLGMMNILFSKRIPDKVMNGKDVRTN